MPLTSILVPLAINAAVSVAAFVALWLINLRTRDPSFIDSWWALGMGLTAIDTFLFTGGARGVNDAHRWLLTGLCLAWALRLGVYLLWRWRKQGPDRRYATMMGLAQKDRGWSYAKASLLLVFALQAPLQYVVSLPVQLGQLGAPRPLGHLASAGLALALIGLAFESLGDWQLARFKGDPGNAGKVLDTGLWRFTRHPNYFGDACVWWGLYLIAADTGLGAWALPGPILLTFLLTRWSGVPTVEGRMRRRRPDYEAYVQRTSGFFPMLPKKG
jgi:steroid 5-alpha reductase family enzyme